MIRQRGFTLIEILVALAVMAVLAGVAIPVYSGYVRESREKVARTNLRMLRLAEDAYFLENNTYLDGSYGKDIAPASANAFAANLGWRPDLDGQRFTYTVDHCAAGTIKTCYTITVSGFNLRNDIVESSTD